MSRRKQQQSRRGRASAIRKIRTDIISQQRIQMKVQKQQCADSNDIIKLNLSHGKMNESIGDKISPPSTGVTTIKSIRSSSKIRRRRRLTSPTKTTAIIIPPTTTTSTLPIAIYYYPSTSLFIMLVVASLLPKHTFSLRWLALSGCGVGIGGCVGGSSSSEGIGIGASSHFAEVPLLHNYSSLI